MHRNWWHFKKIYKKSRSSAALVHMMKACSSATAGYVKLLRCVMAAAAIVNTKVIKSRAQQVVNARCG